MAQKTVIDSLIVELGLDPKKFKAGEKEAVEALRDLEKNAKKTGDEVGKSAEKGGQALVTLGKRAALVAVIFKGLSWATKGVLEASRATYDLANASRLLGESARNLRNFENVGEIFGSTAESVRSSIRGIKSAIHDLAFNGQMSQQLVQLGRLGVQFQDGKTGRARDFKDIYLDTASALQRGVASGQMSESDALMFAESAGFDPGLARSMVGGRDAASLALARQEARRQVSDTDLAGATGAEQAITSAGQAKQTAFTAMGTAGGFGAARRTASVVEGAFNAGVTGDPAVAWEAWTAAIEPATSAVGDFADNVRNASGSLLGWARSLAGKGRAGYEAQIQQSAKRYGLNPELLAGVLNTESGFDPSAVSSAGARGIAQFMPNVANEMGFTAGDDPLVDIDMAAKKIAGLKASFTKTGSDAAAAEDYALMSYNAGERRVRTSSMYPGGAGQLTGETLSYPGRVYEYQASREGGGGTTTVDIGEINVHTAATDANGIASSIADATRRKLTAAQAEQGMR